MGANRFATPVWSAFRVVAGLLFSLHGVASVLGLLGGSQGSGHAVEVGTWPGWWAGLIQLMGGLLVMVGPNGLTPAQNGGVPSALYAWIFLAIAALGAGPWSLDALLLRRKESAVATDTVVNEPANA